MTTTDNGKLIMTNVRCFKTAHLAIKPLTLLVGEGSTGKSTALGCAQTMLETLAHPIGRNWRAFDHNPYAAGKFMHILRNANQNRNATQGGRTQIILTHKTNNIDCRMNFIQDPATLNAMLESIRFRPSCHNKIESLIIKLYDGNKVSMRVNNRSNQISIKMPKQLLYGAEMHDFLIKRLPAFLEIERFMIDNSGDERNTLQDIVRNISAVLPQSKVARLLPVREPAHRLYNYMEHDASGSTSQFPFDMYELSLKEPQKWKSLRKEIVKLGRENDLFSDFYIDRFVGFSHNFSIMAIRDGVKLNICDMGTGVWQMLQPLITLKLADIQQENGQFMFQQPEVQSHPRLHSLVSSMYCSGIQKGHRFIVETHSEHMLDKISMEIKEGRIDPRHVGISFFDHDLKNKCSRIHNRQYDKNGYIMNIPAKYRDFYELGVRNFLSTFN